MSLEQYTGERVLTAAERERLQVLIIEQWEKLPPSRKNEKLANERERQGVEEPAIPTYKTRPQPVGRDRWYRYSRSAA